MSAFIGTATAGIDKILLGTSHAEVCDIYIGRGNSPYWSRSGHAEKYRTSGWNESNMNFDRTPPTTWAQWIATRSDFVQQPNIDRVWIQDADSSHTYTITELRIHRDTRGTDSVDLRLFITETPSSFPITTFPTNKRLLQSIEQGVWKIIYGSTEIEITGPGNPSSDTNDVGDGLYNWKPSTSSQESLKTLLAGLLDGSITDDVVLEIPGLAGNAAEITDFGATKGSGKQEILTLKTTELPNTISISATLENCTSWDLYRIDHNGNSVKVASSPSPATSMSHNENLSSTFKPNSYGWHYNLVAYNSALGDCGTAHASIIVRVITAPSIQSFTASAPASSQAPGVFIQCSTLEWTASTGDPPARWEFSQSGYHLATIPSSRHADPNSSPQRVCTSSQPGETTTLVLTGTNEAGSVSQSVDISWTSQG